jgi:cobalt-zinc-cadmium resistance protein CzcA
MGLSCFILINIFMLSRIIRFSIENKLIVGLFVIGLIGYGSYQFTKLPIDAVPDITNNQVQVITVAPSLGATDIERLVTFPIEQANNNIPGLVEMRSFSRFGLSLVTIVFEDDVDIYRARQQVSERLGEVQSRLPAGMGSVSLGPVTTGLGEIYQYVVRAEKGYEHRYDAMQLRTIQDWVVRRQLLGVKGVADVSSFGGNLKQYEIAVDPARLKSFNITINDVFTALEQNNQNTGGGYIEKNATVLYIRSEGLVAGLDDIRNISVRLAQGGIPLLIKDVADVRFGSATRYGALCYNDQGEVSGAVVMMLKGANSSEVIANVKEKVEQIRQTLPEGVVIEPFLDRTKMVNNAIGTVQTNLLEGALIVLFVLILFLGNLRAGLLVASVIPLSMLFAVIMMNRFGVIGNLMSLGALDFGLIVDGSVFIVEVVLHGLSHSRYFKETALLSQRQVDEEVGLASGNIARSVVFGQIIILIVYLPTFALQGIEGKMFIPMAQTVAFALLGAFILSLTYVPMMSALIMSKKMQGSPNFSDRMMRFFERHYERALSRVLHYKRTVVLVSAGLFSVALVLLSGMGGEFIPALEEGDFAVETRVLSGSSLNTTMAATQQAAKILQDRFPEVEKVVTKIGSGEIPTDPMPMDAGDMIVNLKPKREWTTAATFDELADKMGAAVSEVPGITTSFQFPVQMRFNELMTGAKQDVVCKIFGENMDTLAHYAAELGRLASSVEGTRNLYVEPVTGVPQIVISYNRSALSQYGLNISDINRIVNTGLAGQSTGQVYEGERRFDMVVRLSGEKRSTPEDVKNLLIPVANGSQVPLYQVAEVALQNTPAQIQREDAKRRIIVGFNVKERDVQTIVTELRDKVSAGLKLPEGYYVTYGGAFENLNAAKARLGITVPVSLLLIFLLLFFSFHSVKQGLLIYSAIPLSAIGGIFALALRGMPFSISAGVGFIALFGVAVLNGIVLVAEFNRLRSEGYTDVVQIVLKGTKVRLRPVLITGFVASLGFLPMAISTGSGAEVQRPLATVVIGGLLVATFLTLFVLPVLYILFEKGLGFKRNIVVPLLVAGLCFAAPLNAQTPITLKAALDTAVQNNLVLKNGQLQAEYRKKLLHSGAAIPQTVVTGEYGQINSIYKDTRISVAQGFSFPLVYAREKSVLKEEWRESVLSAKTREALLKREVAEVFYRLLAVEHKRELLLQNDSTYEELLKRSELRFAKGETDVLERSAVQAQRSQIYLQLSEVMQDRELLLLRFRLLLNTPVAVVPDRNDSLATVITPADTSAFREHPFVLQLEAQGRISDRAVTLERSRLLPDLFLAYNDMSMQGTGADNRLYGTSPRFRSVQLGIGIPLFFGSQRARIQAARSGQAISRNRQESGMQAMRSEYLSALAQYRARLEAYNYFRTHMLGTIGLMTQAADNRFANGSIDYLQWVILSNQAVMIRNEYIDLVQQLNESIIHLNYFLSR